MRSTEAFQSDLGRGVWVVQTDFKSRLKLDVTVHRDDRTWTIACVWPMLRLLKSEPELSTSVIFAFLLGNNIPSVGVWLRLAKQQMAARFCGCDLHDITGYE